MRALEKAENWGLLLLLPRVRPARAVARTCGLRAFGAAEMPRENVVSLTSALWTLRERLPEAEDCDRAVLPDAPVRRSRTLPGRP